VALEFKTTLLIKDPIYGYVELTDLEERIIQTPIFQRLRFITQNGLAFYTYPSIRGSRFEHSIGACHLAGRVMTSIFEHSNELVLKRFLQRLFGELQTLLPSSTFRGLEDKWNLKTIHISRRQLGTLKPLVHFVIQLVRLLALLHDLGHLPFSHLGEEAVEPYAKDILKRDDYRKYEKLHRTSDVKLHEYIGYKLLTENVGGITRAFAGSGDLVYLNTIKAFFKVKIDSTKGSRGIVSKLYELIAADIDVDRGDYLRRDGYASGIGFGSYDIDRLVESITLDEVRREGGEKDYLIAPSDASISAVETFLVERYKLYKWLYYHHSIRYFNYCLTKSLDYVIQLRHHLPRLKEKFKIDYFGYRRYASEDGFMANEIWLWDVFYLAHIDLKRIREAPAEVRQALVYLEVIRSRRKLGFTVWKTHPEYIEFNRELKSLVCREQDSESMGPQHCKIADIDLIATQERLFFNLILECVCSGKEFKREFLHRFYQKGIPIHYGDVKHYYKDPALGDEEQVGTVFLVVNEFTPFAKSSISTSEQVVSQFEFLLRKRKDGKKVIRLTEVSRLAASLYEAWQSDIQAYLYFIVTSSEVEKLAAEKTRSNLVKTAQTRFCETLAKWLIEETKLVTIGA